MTTFTSHVTDASTGKPLVGAAVEFILLNSIGQTVANGDLKGVTDSQGYITFQFTVSPFIFLDPFNLPSQVQWNVTYVGYISENGQFGLQVGQSDYSMENQMQPSTPTTQLNQTVQQTKQTVQNFLTTAKNSVTIALIVIAVIVTIGIIVYALVRGAAEGTGLGRVTKLFAKILPSKKDEETIKKRY